MAPKPDRGPDLRPEDTKAIVDLIVETLNMEMMESTPMDLVTGKMKWMWISMKMPMRMNSKL